VRFGKVGWDQLGTGWVPIIPQSCKARTKRRVDFYGSIDKQLADFILAHSWDV
jgi:hypothetical protein